MKGGIRQSNSWLHGWAGLLLGWLMFAIFFTGTIAFFRQEVTFWMQPELHRARAVDPAEAVSLGVKRLGVIAPDAREWGISLPSERNPALRISWDDGREERRGQTTPARGEGRGHAHREGAGAEAQPAASASTPEAALRIKAEEEARRANARGGRPRDPSVVLDPVTGQALAPRETAGGEFLYRFHYQLHAMPREWGRWIVGLATFAMFVAILSGIITHKKIFRDLFTFRRGKGQRSWLDGHNAMAVLSLPFHLMITFSGLLLLGGTLLPWAQAPRGGGHSHPQEHVEERQAHTGGAVPIAQLLAKAEATWGAPAGRVTIERSGGEAQTVRFSIQRNDSLLLRAGGGPGRTLSFDARSGEMLEREDSLAQNAIDGTDRVISALHLGRFASWGMRWLYFAAGVMGTVMIGTGLVLWSVKRAEKRRGMPGTFGHRLVDALNIATLAGLPLATAAYFWSNRLLPASGAQRVEQEILVFFLIWLAALVHALIRPTRQAWMQQLAAGGALFAGLPLLNAMTGGIALPAAVAEGNWLGAGFDLTALLTGAAMLYVFVRLRSHARDKRPLRGGDTAPVAIPAE